MPQKRSEAGVAAKISPRLGGRSPGESTSTIGAVPDLAMEPIDFSTMLESPPRLLPGVVLALRSTPPRRRYSSYQRISSTSRRPTASSAQRSARNCTPSRTSVTSENITLPPPETMRSAA